jgi:hypothetical protein
MLRSFAGNGIELGENYDEIAESLLKKSQR